MIILFLIIGFSLLVIVHEFGHYLAARFFGVRVLEFGIGFPPRLFRRKRGNTIFSVNALPLGGFVRLFGESNGEGITPENKHEAFAAQPAGHRALIIFAGVLMNFLTGWIIFSAVFAIGSTPQLVITGVVEGSPAAAAGILPGDVIVGFSDADAFIAYIDRRRGQLTEFNIERRTDAGLESQTVTAAPRISPPPGEGALGIAFAHVGIEQAPFPKNVTAGLSLSLKAAGSIVVVIYDFFANLFRGDLAADNFVGPVGVVSVAGETARLGFVYLFHLLGLISINLAVLNILPIPALDGGRLIFIIIEKLRGRPVGFTSESATHAIGFIMLILLMILLTVRDVVNLL